MTNKTCVVIEEHDSDYVNSLSSSTHLVYELNAEISIGPDLFKCYAEYMCGEHIVIRNENKVFHHNSDNLFMVSDNQYIHASDFCWELLTVQSRHTLVSIP